MATYAEIKGYESFNWHSAIDQALEYDILTGSNAHRFLQFRAESWELCAVGSQSNLLLRSLSGEPKDQDLAHLGECFTYTIKHCLWLESSMLLSEIEQRSRIILYLQGV